jgi:hypothetical protein
MPTTTPFWIWHAILLAAGLAFILAAGLIPAYGKNIAGWYRYHVFFGGVGATLTIIAVVLVFDAISLSGLFSVFFIHILFGILLLLTLLAALALALFRSYATGPRKAALRSAHLWTGRIFILLMAVNLVLGLTAMGLLFPCLL